MRGKPFRKGFDPRRHALTREERQLGGTIAYAKVEARLMQMGYTSSWLFRRVRKDCRARERVAKGGAA